MNTEEHIIDVCYGVIPYFWNSKGELEFLVVTQEHAHTSFPKGHPNPEEDAITAAARELEEETGIANARIDASKSFSTFYSFVDYDEKIHDKTVYFYLGEVPEQTAVTPEAFTKEITAMYWGTYEETRARLTHENVRGLLDEARQAILERSA
jgi:8-oxo-dGTP pyrophosphatase MutT (NUDIX family)